MNTQQNQSIDIINCSLRVKFDQQHNVFYFTGCLNSQDERHLSKTFREIKNVIYEKKRITLDMHELKFMSQTAISYFYELAKLRLNASVELTIVTTKDMTWQTRWLNNIQSLAKNAGNSVHITYS